MKNREDSVNKNLLFADTDPKAESLYLEHKDKDPFPLIPPALLNSADIADYVLRTGMIYPFNPGRLGPASYEMAFSGEYIYWDEKGNKIFNYVDATDKKLILRKNSITYVSVKEKFRLPHYIAVRFNLRVEHAHRGLLLGTGPLVDPGYQGKLMIPIHNLTENEYVISAGDDIISVEFTKTSPYVLWHGTENKFAQMGCFEPNTLKNSKKTFDQLITKFLPSNIINVMSSLSGALYKFEKELQSFKKHKYAWSAGGFAVVIALFALGFQLSSIISDANKYVSDSTIWFKGQIANISNQKDFATKNEIEALREELHKIVTLRQQANSKQKTDNENLESLSLEVNRLNAIIAMLQQDIENIRNSSSSEQSPK